VQPEVEGIPAEDVAHVVGADDHHLEAHLLGNGLQPGWRHLARAADGEPVARDDERLPRMHPGAEIGHQMAEGTGLPALVQRLEALGDAVGRGGDLVGVDRVQLLPGRARIPEDERGPADEGLAARGSQIARARGRQRLERHAGLQDRGLGSLHN
jgi:hypothetical protein